MGEVTNFRGDTTAAIDTDATVDTLITRVGDRVRKARELKGIPRRVLSDVSGVSPRYLAQLEAGEGNVSIGLLQRVAIALDFRIDWLISDEDPWSSDVLRAADLFRSANADVRAKAMAVLCPENESHQRARRICLVGLRGAGKSTLGGMAGEALGVSYVLLNHEIEEQAGMPINEILGLYGQEGYRKLEAQALERVVATHDTLILEVAGGIVAEPETYTNLLRHFHTIWVKASPQEHMERVRAQGDTRPMAGNPEAMEQLRSILASREALYDKALAQLDTSGKTPAQSSADLRKLIQEHAFLA